MDWKQILSNFINDVNSNETNSLLKSKLVAARDKGSAFKLDPGIKLNLALNAEFCDLITKFNFKLEAFTAQLSIIYCELLDMYGLWDRPEGFADPAKGDDSFTPDTVGYFWRNFYNIKDVNEFLDSLQGLLYKKHQDYKNTVNEASLRESSRKIHLLFLDVLEHSYGAAQLIDSSFINIPVNYYKHRAEKEFRSLKSFSGEKLKFYTVGKTHRFMDIDQTLKLLMNSGGVLKKRVMKKDLAACHYYLLSLMAVSGFLTQSSYQVSLSFRYIDGSLINNSVKKIKKQYVDQLWGNGIHLS